MVTEGATSAVVSITASVSGSASTPVVPNVGVDSAVFQSAVISGSGPYTLSISTLPDLAIGTHTSSINFRLCQDAGCASVYPNTTQTFTYTLTVRPMEWTTFQRNAAHTGYVHATLDPTKFQTAWTWISPDPGPLSDVIPVGGNAYVMSLPARLRSLDETTGAVNWTSSLSTPVAMDTLGAPSYDNGVIYVPSKYAVVGGLDPGEAAIRAFDAATGAYKSDSPYFVQSSEMNSPTFADGEMFHAAGHFANTLYKYAPPATAPVWSTTLTPSNSGFGQTPAVDKTRVYFSTQYGVAIFNRSNGSLIRRYSDPLTFLGGRMALMAPVIAPSGHIIVNDPMIFDQIIAVDPETATLAWRTADDRYSMQPVVAGAVVYAVRFGTTVDAISDIDGKLIWSWSLPAGDFSKIAENNMIVFDNLLFVSSDEALYAIDLGTRQTVWTSSVHGRLSFSAGFVLYVVDRVSTPRKITAIKLAG